MGKLFAQVTIGGAIAFLIFRVADDQLGISAKINNMLRGQ